MAIDPTHLADQQYFPTYNLPKDAEEVALREYDLSVATVASEERVLNLSTSALVAIIGIATAALNENPKALIEAVSNGLERKSTIALGIMISLITIALTLYFADTRKSVVYASRKIIILRRMLGLSYGRIELILPNRRLEGANEPYHIRMFHGWCSTKATPLYCICCASGVLVWLAAPAVLNLLPTSLLNDGIERYAPATMGILWAGGVALIYRLLLTDHYESLWRLVAVSVARIFRQPITQDFEYILYRARLAVFEAERLKIPVKSFFPIVLELEDRTFYSHRGVSLRAIGRAAYAYMRSRKKSGASTVSQQLVRTLFIKQLRPTFRRKIVEILLALWIERHFTKTEILEMYVCCVRYEMNVYGVAEAVKHFFPLKKTRSLTKPEIFFLAERVANIRSRLLAAKVSENLKHLLESKLLSSEEINEVADIFRKQRLESRIIFKDSDLAAMLEGLPT